VLETAPTKEQKDGFSTQTSIKSYTVCAVCSQAGWKPALQVPSG